MIELLLNFISWEGNNWKFSIFLARWWKSTNHNPEFQTMTFFSLRSWFQRKSALKLMSHGIFVLFVFSGSIKKLFSIDCVNIFLLSIFFSVDFARWKRLFSIDCVNIYFFSMFFSIDFARCKSVGLSHIAYMVIA